MKKLHSLVRILAVALVLTLPCVVLAQVVSSTVSTSTVAEPTPVEIFELGKKIYDDWKTAGVLAGIVALINLLVNLTKIKLIADWIEQKKLKWLRPVLAVLLGAMSGAAGALAVGSNIPMGVVHGLLTGGAAIGLHELYSVLRGER
jgi:hypothetical protein